MEVLGYTLIALILSAAFIFLLATYYKYTWQDSEEQLFWINQYGEDFDWTWWQATSALLGITSLITFLALYGDF